MKYLKLFEEFSMDVNETYESIPFTDNEEKYLNSKGQYYNDMGYGYFKDQKIEKISDGYYIVNKTIKCNNIQDMMKACNDAYQEVADWFTYRLDNSTQVNYTDDGVQWVYDNEVWITENLKDEMFLINSKDWLYLRNKYSYDDIQTLFILGDILKSHLEITRTVGYF